MQYALAAEGAQSHFSNVCSLLLRVFVEDIDLKVVALCTGKPWKCSSPT